MEPYFDCSIKCLLVVISESSKRGETMTNKWTESLKLLTMAITMTVDIEVKSDHCVNIISVSQ